MTASPLFSKKPPPPVLVRPASDLDRLSQWVERGRQQRFLIEAVVTPEMAAWLLSRNAENRVASTPTVETYAASLGVDERTIRRDLARGKKIAPEVLAEVSGTDLDKGVVLDELARAPQAEQRAKLAEIAERRSAVRPAPDPLNDPEAHERQLSALMSAWNRAAAVVRQEFLLRIDEPVFDHTSAGVAA